MALIDFLNNTANITRQTTINNNGIVEKITSVIYTGIPCHIYKSFSKLDETNISENTELGNLNMICEADKTNIKKGDLVEIIDPDLGTIGNYQVNFIKMNRLSGGNDSLEITLSNI